MPRVLIADDEAVILLQLEDSLATMGVTVVGQASSGQEAVALARKLRPDVALLDIVMPGALNGIEACRIMQEELGIPVVLMSAYSDEAHLTQARAVSPAGYVVKPFQPDQVVAALQMATGTTTDNRLARLLEGFGDGVDDLVAAILESSSLGLAVCDAKGRVVYLNSALRAMSGLSSVAATIADLPGAAAQGSPSPDAGPVVMGRPGAPPREAEVRATPLAGGRTLYTYTDVTSLRAAKRALAAHERILSARARIADAFLTTNDVDLYSRVATVLVDSFCCEYAIFGYIDADGTLIAPSLTGADWELCAMADKHFVFPPETWRGCWGDSLRERKTVRRNSGLAPPPNHPRMDNALAVPVLHGRRLIGQFLLANKPGGFDPSDAEALESLAAYCAPILDARLERDAMEKERMRTSLALMHSQERYRQIVETSLEGIWTIDAGGLTTYVNRNLAEMLGHEPEHMTGRHYYEFMDQASLIEAERRLEKCRQGFSAQYDFRFQSATGVDVWAICSHSPLIGPGGEYLGALIMTSNITYRKFAEDSLLESEERFRQLVENLNEVFWIREFGTGQALYVSPSFETVWGREAGGFLAQPFVLMDSAHPEDRDRLRKVLERFKADHQPYAIEYRIVRPDGQTRWVRTNGFAVLDEAGQPFRDVGISEDVTERKRAALERDRLARAIEQVGDIVIITDDRGTIQYANPAFERISGHPRRTVLGENIAVLDSKLDDAAYLTSLYRALSDGVPWSGRYCYTRPDGALREVKATLAPILDAVGRVAHYVSVQRDVTEEMQLESQLNQARKMEALGTLAGGIAHDFNNILMAIMGFSELALGGMPKDSRQRAHIERVLQAGDRARNLVRQILAFSRRGELERGPIELAPLVKETLGLLRATLPANIGIRREIDSGAGSVLADPSQIHQIVMNLSTNAAYVLERAGGGTITVRLERRTVTAEDGAAGGLPPGRYLALEIGDDGPGIPASILDRVFDPFFTTKAPGEGTGMGLAVVHGTAHGLGGAVFVDSPPGRGARFTVLLPAVQSGEQKPQPSPPLLHGTERILYVDDEKAITDLASQTLGDLGYAVTACTAPGDALELLRTATPLFDILVTDQAMPGFTGLELAREARKLHPGLPVILCTGFSRTTSPQALREHGVKRLIMKPFEFEALASAIRAVLAPDDPPPGQ